MRVGDGDFRFRGPDGARAAVVRDRRAARFGERYTGARRRCRRARRRSSRRGKSRSRARTAQRKADARSIVIAAGARPFVPPIPGIEEVGYLTSDTVWNLRELPRRLVVLGGGPIGCELAQAFARLGAEVTQVEMAPRLMIREDPEVSEMVDARAFAPKGIDVLTQSQGEAASSSRTGEKVLIAEHEGATCASPSTPCWWPSAASPTSRATGWRNSASPTGKRARWTPTNSCRPTTRTSTPRRRGRPLPVHPHRRAPGLVRGGQCAVRSVQEVQGRLLGDPLGHLRRTRSGARRPQRAGGEGKGHRLRSQTLRHRRPRPRDCRRRGARLRQGADRARQGPHPRRHHRRRARRRPDRRIRAGDEARHRAEQDPRHHPHLPDAGRGQQVRAGNWKKAHAPQRLLAWVERFHAWRVAFRRRVQFRRPGRSSH
jgi:hypothetical protein